MLLFFLGFLKAAKVLLKYDLEVFFVQQLLIVINTWYIKLMKNNVNTQLSIGVSENGHGELVVQGKSQQRYWSMTPMLS